MNQIRGFCNRICNECEIFKVTQADDDQKRAAMAVAVSNMFDQDFKPDNINCNGCTAPGGHHAVGWNNQAVDGQVSPTL